MKTLCLFANEFPYGVWEPYLETEINYYKQFDKVYIFSLQLRKEHSMTRRNVPDNCEVFPVPYASKLKYLLYSLKAITDKHLYIELLNLIKTHRFGLKQIVNLFVFISRSHYETKLIYKYILDKELGETCFYSYRFEYQPYVALLLKEKLHINAKVISRAHRFDLYEERRPHKYIPCRNILLDKLDYVYPCSEDGTQYLRKQFPIYCNKISTRYLGTTDYGIQEYVRHDTFRIVSCSTVTPVKRIDLIIDALKRIPDIKIEWIHFGDGPLMSMLKEQLAFLPPNITASLRGNVDNKTLLEEYRRSSFDLFINVSESEGLPVSIMEAMSFGIPCIATNVGGTKEIVNERNGILLDFSVDAQGIAIAIEKIIGMGTTQYNELRFAARNDWNQKFNAKLNYQQFIQEIISWRR